MCPSMPFIGFIVSFFSLLYNILISECTTVYLSIYLLKDIFSASNFTVLNKAAIKVHVWDFMLT